MKRAGSWLTMLTLGIAITGCATTQTRPSVYVYPKQGQAMEQFNQDQLECQTWAKQQTDYDSAAGETARGAGVGAVLGALGGAVIGVATGAVTGSPGTGAAVGAISGGMGGAIASGGTAYGKSQEGYDRAYGACMTGHGYAVK